MQGVLLLSKRQKVESYKIKIDSIREHLNK